MCVFFTKCILCVIVGTFNKKNYIFLSVDNGLTDFDGKNIQLKLKDDDADVTEAYFILEKEREWFVLLLNFPWVKSQSTSKCEDKGEE